jgi:Kef-type K+ transport system membrane component KefB
MTDTQEGLIVLVLIAVYAPCFLTKRKEFAWKMVTVVLCTCACLMAMIMSPLAILMWLGAWVTGAVSRTTANKHELMEQLQTSLTPPATQSVLHGRD